MVVMANLLLDLKDVEGSTIMPGPALHKIIMEEDQGL
jgi:hypothetical protein